jgi:hypothetical protein
MTETTNEDAEQNSCNIFTSKIIPTEEIATNEATDTIYDTEQKERLDHILQGNSLLK